MHVPGMWSDVPTDKTKCMIGLAVSRDASKHWRLSGIVAIDDEQPTLYTYTGSIWSMKENGSRRVTSRKSAGTITSIWTSTVTTRVVTTISTNFRGWSATESSSEVASEPASKLKTARGGGEAEDIVRHMHERLVHFTEKLQQRIQTRRSVEAVGQHCTKWQCKGIDTQQRAETKAVTMFAGTA